MNEKPNQDRTPCVLYFLPGEDECNWDERKCTHCKKFQPIHEFKKAHGPGGLNSWCRTCVKYRAILRKYGITRDQYDEMVRRQGGRCANCGEIPEDRRYCGGLNVDHHHVTGKVRELLCDHCNTGIGLFNDSPELLEQTAAYLRKHQ